MEAGRVLEVFQRLTSDYRIPGAQLAVYRRGTTTAIEVGEQEHGTGRALTPASKFPVGSISKAVTATLAMILVSDGELELDAPVTDYLAGPESVPGQLWPRLTLRHLLSHTSGLADDDLSPPPDARPRVEFSYSSRGYVLVGRLIESVTGMTWWDAVEAILLRPLGISAAFIVDPRPRRANTPVVTGHSVNRRLNRTCTVEQTLTPAEAPVGGLAMSAMDLVAFGRLHLPGDDGSTRGLPFSRSVLMTMREPVPQAEPFGLADGWGLGLALFRDERTVWWGHDGNADGTSCHLRIDPENETVVAVTTNANIGFAMWKELVGELPAAGLAVGDYVAPGGTEPRVAPSIDCVGDYVNGQTKYSIVTGANAALHLAVDGEPFAELARHEGLLFSMRDVTTGESVHVGRFLRDPDTGRVDRIQVGGRMAWRIS